MLGCGLMTKEDAAFNRFIDFMSRMVEKYGEEVLAEIDNTDEESYDV